AERDSELNAAIGLDSTLDLTAARRFAELPNLAFLTQAGFPFTRLADLSETALVLPAAFTARDLEAAFRILGSFGGKTGYPALGLRAVTAGAVETVADRDLLAVGTFTEQPLINRWARFAPLEVSGDLLHVELRRPAAPLNQRLAGLIAGDGFAPDLFLRRSSVDGVVYGFESPLSAKRSVVIVSGRDGAGVKKAANAIASGDAAGVIQGGFAAITPQGVESYTAGSPYHVGSLPPFMHARLYLSQRPWTLGLIFVTTALLLAVAGYGLIRTRAVTLEKGTD
ncbi:MAG: cellulose biosynthesis cyclic di-GMP-binding regulatory protein BcsB, partial [Pseudomonadota bacterium]